MNVYGPGFLFAIAEAEALFSNQPAPPMPVDPKFNHPRNSLAKHNQQRHVAGGRTGGMSVRAGGGGNDDDDWGKEVSLKPAAGAPVTARGGGAGAQFASGAAQASRGEPSKARQRNLGDPMTQVVSSSPGLESCGS